MKIKNIIFIICLSLIVGFAGWKILKTPEAAIVNQSHKDIYYCPMHTHYTSNHPGSCPICGMKLVKKENSAANDSALQIQRSAQPSVPGYSTVLLNSQKEQFIGLKTTPVSKKSLVKTIHAYGYAAHDLELYEAQLGYIDAWHKYYAFVLRRTIKENYRPDWWKYYKDEPPQDRWLSDEKLKAQERFVKAEYELKHMGLDDVQLDQLRQIKPGQPWVQPDLLFFHEGHPVWIYAQIFESDLGFVDVGQKVVVTIPEYHETTEGLIQNVSLMVDPATRTTQVRIALPKYRGELKVNMLVNVDIPVELDSNMIIPREAVMDTGLNKVVFVKVKEGTYEPRNIQTGFEGDGMVAVKSGLKEGETIVVSGNFLLDSESRLEGALTEGSTHD